MDSRSSPFELGVAEQTCFVYETKTGYVVHIHQFFPVEPGGRCEEADMERTALENTSSLFPRDSVGVFHHAGELKIEPGYRYRIDADRRAYLAEPIEPPKR